jgi:hypothetical protein
MPGPGLRDLRGERAKCFGILPLPAPLGVSLEKTQRRGPRSATGKPLAQTGETARCRSRIDRPPAPRASRSRKVNSYSPPGAVRTNRLPGCASRCRKPAAWADANRSASASQRRLLCARRAAGSAMASSACTASASEPADVHARDTISTERVRHRLGAVTRAHDLDGRNAPGLRETGGTQRPMGGSRRQQRLHPPAPSGYRVSFDEYRAAGQDQFEDPSSRIGFDQYSPIVELQRQGAGQAVREQRLRRCIGKLDAPRRANSTWATTVAGSRVRGACWVDFRPSPSVPGPRASSLKTKSQKAALP